MIAQGHDRAVPEVAHEAERLQRRRPPVHEIADEPQSVAGRVETDVVEQAPKGVEAALEITDRVCGHGNCLGLPEKKKARCRAFPPRACGLGPTSLG